MPRPAFSPRCGSPSSSPGSRGEAGRSERWHSARGGGACVHGLQHVGMHAKVNLFGFEKGRVNIMGRATTWRHLFPKVRRRGRAGAIPQPNASGPVRAGLAGVAGSRHGPRSSGCASRLRCSGRTARRTPPRHRCAHGSFQRNRCVLRAELGQAQAPRAAHHRAVPPPRNHLLGPVRAHPLLPTRLPPARAPPACVPPCHPKSARFSSRFLCGALPKGHGRAKR